eukprot:scaffold73687_cov36-Attheya_sp.AAC.3
MVPFYWGSPVLACYLGVLVVVGLSHSATGFSISSSSQFQVRILQHSSATRCGGSCVLQMSDANEGADGPQNLPKKKKGGRTPKKRRFVQEAHPVVVAPPMSPTNRMPRTSTTTSANTNKDEDWMAPLTRQPDGSFRRVPNAAMPATTSRRPPPNNSSQQRNGEEATNAKNFHPPPLRSGKSIEDLEAIMNKRWGTQLQAFQANPNEYEMDDEQPEGSGGGGGIFRSRPVLDPWDETPKPKENNGKTRDDVSLEKVRQNQERLRRMRNNGGSSSPNDTASQGSPIEFYDEDDEGYESPLQNSKQRKQTTRPNQPQAQQRQSDVTDSGIYDGEEDKSYQEDKELY